MANNRQSNDIILEIDVRYEDAVRGIAQYNQQIEQLRDQNKQTKAENKELIRQNKELEQQYNSGVISLQQYNQQLRVNNDIIDANNVAIESNNIAIQQRSAQTRTLRQEVQRNIQIENTQIDSIKRLEAEIAELNRAYEQMGDTQERSETAAHILELQNRLNGLNEARGRFQAQVGNYRNAILDTLGLNSQFSQSLLSLSQNAQTGQNSLSSFFSNGVSSIKAFGSSLLALMANPVFLAIAGIAGAAVAFKFWYDYNKGLQEATKLTKQFTNLSGNDLKAFRNEIQGIADTFDQDFKTTLEATNALSKQFGISQQEAMSIVKDGFVAGADANGEYLDTIKEYAPAFREAGLSASEFVSTLADTNKNGVISDKAADTIKEANTRLREMTTATSAALDGIGISSKEVQKSLSDGSTTTFDVMQKVSTKLNELQPQSKEVGTAIADIFGSAGEDAGLQYLKTLKDIDTNLDSTKQKAGELGAIQEKQMNANIELQNVIAGLFDQTGGTFETMIGNAKVFATESITSIIKGIVKIINWVLKLYNDSLVFRGIIVGIMTSFKNLWEVVKQLFDYMMSTFKVIGKAFRSAFTFDYEGLIDAYAEYGKNTADTLKKTLNNIVQNEKDAYNQIKNGKIDPIEIPATLKVDNDGYNVDEIKKMRALFSGMSKKELDEWIKDEKNATDKYLQLAKEILLAKSRIATSNNVDSKAIENEKKAAFELAKYQTDLNAKAQKEIIESQRNSYEDRIKALQDYGAIQKNMIDLQLKNDLSQVGLTESQKALIRAKSNQQLVDLDKELYEQTKKINSDQVEIYKTNLNNKLALAKDNSKEQLEINLQLLKLQRDEEIKNANEIGASVSLIRAKYAQLEIAERQKQSDYLAAQREVDYQNQILQAQLNNENTLSMEIAHKQLQIATLTQLDEESDADFLNRKLLLQVEMQDLTQQMQDQTLAAVLMIGASFTDFFETLGEQNQAFAALAKTTAVAEIAIAKATAIAKGIAAAQAAPFPLNLGAIATTIAAILSGFTQVSKVFKSSSSSSSKGYATGGLVTGEGSGTSDSINARLSNGESVLTAQATQMFMPILSEFNQIGGGVPIQTQSKSTEVQGESVLQKLMVEALSSMPAPVVSVQEINNVDSRIKVLETDNMI